MKDIQIGDYVFDENGAPTRVDYVTEPMYDHKCYEVVFSDGTKEVADAEHLWVTETNACRKAWADIAGKNKVKRRRFTTEQKPEARSTQEIKDTLLVPAGKAGLKPNHSIPVCGPVQFSGQDLLIPPYTMGAWLGDGCASGGSNYACHILDSEVIDAIRADGFTVNKGSAEHTWHIQNFTKLVDNLGLLNNKHIPEQYLIGSIEQRLSLLQGLMDTDGTISKRGDCCFDNTNKDIADGVAELASSLGIKVNREERYGKINGVTHKLCYRVHFTTDLPVFRLKRKLSRLRPIAMKARRRYIVAVNDVASVPVKCIRVESPNHLFLLGKSFIPTHNTFGCAIAVIRYAWNHKHSLVWWVAPTYAHSQMAYNTILDMLPVGFYQQRKADLEIDILDPAGNKHSTIAFKSSDKPENLRGYAVNFFVMDEAAICKEAAYVALMTTLTQTKGKGIYISTPKGRNWFYECYQKGEKLDDEGNPLFDKDNPDPNEEWFAIRMPTWSNPHVDMQMIYDFKKNQPEDVFRQEIAAQFLMESAGVFLGIMNCVDREAKFENPIPGRRYVMGVDLARINDFTVVTVADTTTNQIVFFERFNKIKWEVQYHKITLIARRYNNCMVVMDSTGIGDPIVEAIQRAGVYVNPYKIGTNTAKKQLIDKLRLALQNRRITFPYIPILVKELQSYEYSVSDGNVTRYTSPSGIHDDCVISLALCNWALSEAPFTYSYKSVRGV